MRHIVFAGLLVACAVPAYAQWLTHPTPGLPRTADGKPNLSAPAPRTADGHPDFSGVWTTPGVNVRAAASDMKPWVADARHRHAEDFYRARPMFRCLPSGPATYSQSTGGGVWKRIVQTRGLIVILNDDLTFRQVHMDGRALETNPHPSWMGYSVGRWEGDTLVVDSNGFNDKTWLNDRGIQHTEALRVTERISRADLGHLRIEVTFTDPQALVKPISMTVRATLGPDTELLERVCEHSSEEWVGTAANVRDAAVNVPPDVLARYVGVYTGFWVTSPRKVDVRLVDGTLVVRINDDDEELPLTPLSNRLFQSTEGLAYDFESDGRSAATHVVEDHVSGGYRYARQR